MIRIETRYRAKIAEQFSPWYEFHHEVQVSCVLCESLQLNLSEEGGTIKGCRRVLKI